MRSWWMQVVSSAHVMVLSNFDTFKILQRFTEVNRMVGWFTDIEQVIKLAIWSNHSHVNNASADFLIIIIEIDIGFGDPQRISVTFLKQTPGVYVTQRLSHSSGRKGERGRPAPSI